MRSSNRGIALLITLFFIISITLAVGIGLKQVNEARAEIEQENFMIQSSVVLDDVLKILTKMSKEYDVENDADGEGFYTFLEESAFIPFESSGIKTLISIDSARSKLNINAFADANLSTKEALESYFESRMVGLEYVDMLFDVIKGIRVEPPYRTDIVHQRPLLIKDTNNYISSYENLREINEFYKLSYHDNKIDKINFKNLFYFSADSNYSLDLNCISPAAKDVIWASDVVYVEDETQNEEMLEQTTPCSVDFCASLSEEEKSNFNSKYNATCIPQRNINVVVEVMQHKQHAKIMFEYSMDSKKGSNFVYEL
jgi:hypothetical protein